MARQLGRSLALPLYIKRIGVAKCLRAALRPSGSVRIKPIRIVQVGNLWGRWVSHLAKQRRVGLGTQLVNKLGDLPMDLFDALICVDNQKLPTCTG